MKKFVAVFLTVLVSGVFLFGHFALAGDGPAPNSGDGISDGSGFTDKGADRDDKGAPNSGDGISDGSGFTDKGTVRGHHGDHGASNSGKGSANGRGK